ncbi:MAG: RhuM family protein [Prevotella sp.]|nr:RhuM family protein [Prevotella sp.]
MENNQNIPIEEKGEIVLYQPDDNVRLEVRLQDDTVWLTQLQMAELFKSTKQNISLHVNNIFREGELAKNSVVKECLTTASDGKNYRTKYYNLDVIISVGYRVKSSVGTRFRQWANAVLKDYLLRGYAVHQQVMALQQINLRIDAQNDRLTRIEDTIEQQQQQLDFVVRANEKPEELLIPTGCVWDAYMFVCDLIRSARKQLVLIDNFVDDRVLTMLDKRNTGVAATVYTRYTKQITLDFEKHNRQYAPIEYVQMPHAVHDRYLIVDYDVWLLGTSVKDMGRGLCTIIKVGFKPEEVLRRIV